MYFLHNAASWHRLAVSSDIWPGRGDALDLGGLRVSSVGREYCDIFRHYGQFKEFSGITLSTRVLPL